MKREIFGRALMGFPIGIAIGYCITIAISWSVGDGLYYPCVPAMEAQMGSQIAAATLQTCLLYTSRSPPPSFPHTWR